MTSGSPGAAASVCEHVGVVWKIYLNDSADVLHVQAARCDVGRHQVLHGTATKLVEGGGSLALSHLAVEGTCREPRCAQLFRKSHGLGPRAHEQQGLVFGVTKQHVDRRVESVRLAYEHHDVLDVGVGLAEHRSLHRNRVLLKSIGQSHDFARERGGHQVRPAGVGRIPEDAV